MTGREAGAEAAASSPVSDDPALALLCVGLQGLSGEGFRALAEPLDSNSLMSQQCGF